MSIVEIIAAVIIGLAATAIITGRWLAHRDTEPEHVGATEDYADELHTFRQSSQTSGRIPGADEPPLYASLADEIPCTVPPEARLEFTRDLWGYVEVIRQDGAR